MHVFGRKARVEKTLLHGRGRRGHVALGRVGGVDLDELLEDLAGLGAVCRGRGGQRVLGMSGGKPGGLRGRGRDKDGNAERKSIRRMTHCIARSAAWLANPVDSVCASQQIDLSWCHEKFEVQYAVQDYGCRFACCSQSYRRGTVAGQTNHAAQNHRAFRISPFTHRMPPRRNTFIVDVIGAVKRADPENPKGVRYALSADAVH